MSHNHSCIIAQSFHYYLNSSFRCHSGVVSLSFQCRFSARGITKFCRWNDPETKLSLVLVSFYFRTMRNEKLPRSRERQERNRNDPNCSGNEEQTVAKEGRTIQDLRSSHFSFLSFGHRSSFESRSESFRKKRKFRNDTGTRSERGGRVGKSGSVSPSRT